MQNAEESGDNIDSKIFLKHKKPRYRYRGFSISPCPARTHYPFCLQNKKLTPG